MIPTAVCQPALTVPISSLGDLVRGSTFPTPRIDGDGNKLASRDLSQEEEEAEKRKEIHENISDTWGRFADLTMQLMLSPS